MIVRLPRGPDDGGGSGVPEDRVDTTICSSVPVSGITATCTLSAAVPGTVFATYTPSSTNGTAGSQAYGFLIVG